jgi:D-alanine transaminase
VGLELLRERAPEIRSRHLPFEALFAAREVIAVNAVRGPRPVVEIDGRPIGSGASGPVAAHLQALFRSA